LIIDWPTFLVGLLASLIVALVTFILGLKSGKNQADRQHLQDLYKTLLVHFNDIEECLYTYPRKWEHYEEKKVSWGGKYLPPVKKLENSGDSIYIKKKLFDEAIVLERDALNYGEDISSFYKEFLTRVAESSGLFNVHYSVEKEAYQRKCLHVISPKKDKYSTGIMGRLFYFLLPNQREPLKRFFKNSGYTSFQGDGSTINWELVITPDTYDDVDVLIDKLISLAESCETYQKLTRGRKELSSRINMLTKKLERKAKEPISFWETFVGAFWDVFKP